VALVVEVPADSHDPIRYPLLLCRPDSAQAREFYRYLQSEEAAAVFRKYGFTPMKHIL
jgi:molybdate transport system substrate-binding protein